MNLYHKIDEIIGHTPLLALDRLAANLGATVAVKLECMNPAGSAKDRAAMSMLDDAEAKGLLHQGSVIIEPTSGNTGVGLAAIGIPRGYRVILTMPETMSAERRSLLKAYGAELVLTDGKRGMTGAIEKARELARDIPGAFIPGQFVNPANTDAHYTSTGPEIWNDTDGKIDIFVAGVGTGGTITGVARYLKEQNPAVRIVAVEPENSPVLSGGQAGPHGLMGIGAGFVPDILRRDLIDEVITVSDADAYAAGRKLARTEGILAGITSGAALCAALTLAARPENRDKFIVALLPDTGERYLSTPLFSE
ncbi:MAG: cysteine synthase A [Eubacteriales bacterium]|jgi:cysteine synthase A